MALRRLLIPPSSFLDRTIGWDRLPRPLAIVTLIGLRERLRRQNLHDTGLVKPRPARPRRLDIRTLDGVWNDVHEPATGSVGTRFGRNIPLDHAYPEGKADFREPSPRVVSQKLLARDGEFIAADTLNLLAAAWIQFEVHDWLSHDTDAENPISVELEDDDKWPEKPMRIPSTRRDPSAATGAPPAFATSDTHWWDGSQIYGQDDAFQCKARTHDGGKLLLDDDDELHPRALDKFLEPEGPRGNFWVGLALLHALFIREHNAICDALKLEHPNWSDDQLYDKARLINAAVMAKIHTVEWTPAIIAHPTTELAMRVNWYGLAGERVRRKVGRIGRGDLLSGIRGSPTDDHGTRYSLTEEFVSVYRMHPLIPDEYTFRSLDGRRSERRTFAEIGPRRWRDALHQIGVGNALYSFGIANPGAIVLHNYPTSLTKEFRPDEKGPPVDLATVDLLRDRERGVPRYNEFRTLMHRKPVGSFEELTQDARVASELRDVYGHVDRIDLMVGLYAEPRPKGFAFSDTAFRVFVLMASRRLKSDRFFTSDYTRRVYTQTGLDWIEKATMSKILVRHHKELAAVIRPDNAFKPWDQGR